MDSGEIESKVSKSLQSFKKNIKREFKPEEFILFGSRAKGDCLAYSDFDFIIVSKKFTGMPWPDRISRTVKYWNSEIGIDVLPYTPIEFKEKKKQRTIVRQAVKEGISL